MNNIFLNIPFFWDKLIRKCGDTFFYPALLGTLGCIGLIPLLYPGIPQGHDLFFHLARLQGMLDALNEGVFPIRVNFSALDGYGYASGLFYPDFFAYIPVFFAKIGISLINSYKLFLFIWWFFAVYSMYFSLTKMGVEKFGAFAGALLYGWSSYFATDIFNRAAFGEVLAFPFIPMVILGLYNLIYGNFRNNLPLIFGFSALFLAHQITFILMCIISFLWCVLNIILFLRKLERILFLFISIFITFVLVSFFFLPMLEQMQYMEYNLTSRTIKSSIIERAVPFTRLWLELPYMKLEYWIPPGIGIIFLIIASQRLRFTLPPNIHRRTSDGLLIIGFGCLLAATNFLPWEGMMKALAGIQFPWRFYLPATAFLAAGCGFILSHLTQNDISKIRYWTWILFVGCGFAWYFNVAYVYAAKIHEGKMLTNFSPSMAGRLVASGIHYLPSGMDIEDIEERGKIVLSKNTIRMRPSFSANGETTLTFEGNSSDNQLEFPIIPYKGYAAQLILPGQNHIGLPILISSNSLLSVDLPKEYKTGKIHIYYKGTLVQKISAILSGLFFLGICVYKAFFVRRSRLI
ncbi:MAG: hypothetical protein EOM44_06810 [Bacteroidia bacterium]|nr:hypothetical protein [Bacteroidia bacterium]